MSAWKRTYARRYRKRRIGYTAEIVCLYGEWVDRFMGEAPRPTIEARAWRPTERGIRRWCARRLWRQTRPKGWQVAS